MDIATIVSLIEQGLILIPKFEELWAEISTTFSSTDKATVDAALAKAKARDAADTAQADIDLDEAEKRTT